MNELIELAKAAGKGSAAQVALQNKLGGNIRKRDAFRRRILKGATDKERRIADFACPSAEATSRFCAKSPTAMPLSSAEKVSAFRARAKKCGLCCVCGQRKPRPRRKTCKPCNESAKERVAASRE